MISPYLRRPLRSLDEMLTEDSDESAAKKVRASKLPKPTAGAAARTAESTAADTKKTIASNP